MKIKNPLALKSLWIVTICLKALTNRFWSNNYWCDGRSCRRFSDEIAHTLYQGPSRFSIYSMTYQIYIKYNFRIICYPYAVILFICDKKISCCTNSVFEVSNEIMERIVLIIKCRKMLRYASLASSWLFHIVHKMHIVTLVHRNQDGWSFSRP